MSAARLEPERGCVVLDQPQHVGSSKASGACRVLRLVEDDTAALRSNSTKPDWEALKTYGGDDAAPAQGDLSR